MTAASINRTVEFFAHTANLCEKDYTVWWQLDDVQFMRMLHRLVQKAPLKTAAMWRHVESRAGEHPHMLDVAMKHLAEAFTQPTLHDLQVLRHAPIALRMAVVRHLAPFRPFAPDPGLKWWQVEVPLLEFALEVLYSVDPKEAEALFDNIMATFAALHPVVFFRTLYIFVSWRGTTPQRAIPSLRIFEKAEKRLWQFGYEVGVIEFRRSKSGPQPYIRKGAMQYTLAPRASYRPQNKEVVVFSTRGKRLKSTVATTIFIPLHNVL